MSSKWLQGIIENPILELKIISANDVSYIDATEKLDVYAVVSIKDENTQQEQAAKTPIDYDGGSNPTWNHTVKFSVNEREVNEGLLTIYIKLFSYWLEGKNDLYLGEVSVSVQELLASNPLSPFANGHIDKMKLMTYKVIGETKPNTKLSLSYRFKPVPLKGLYPSAPDYSLSIGQPVYPNPEPMLSGQPIMYSPPLQATTVKGLELVIKFAKDIKKVHILNEMNVYALVTIREGKKTIEMTKTPIAFSAYQSPKWDHNVTLSLHNRVVQEGRLMLSVELISHRNIFGDTDIGVVNVSFKELLSMNPPSPLTNGDCNDMMLMTQDVTGSYGKKGTLTFTYRFLTNSQPVMYLPVSHQAYASQDSTNETSGYGYMSVHPGAHVRPNNGAVPICMPSPYQSNGYQHYSPQQSQSELQESQLQPQLQQPQPQPLLDTQAYQSYGYQHYSSSPEPLPPQQPTQSQAQTQQEIGTIAAVLGQTIGGALLSEFISSEVNI